MCGQVFALAHTGKYSLGTIGLQGSAQGPVADKNQSCPWLQTSNRTIGRNHQANIFLFGQATYQHHYQVIFRHTPTAA